jgi:hypothetical protein
MLCWIPKLEQSAPAKLPGAADKRLVCFDAPRYARRIGQSHLARSDRRHGEIAAIECGRDQGQSACFGRHVDAKPVESRQFVVELGCRPNRPCHVAVTAGAAAQQWNVADKDSLLVARNPIARPLGGKRTGAQSRHRKHAIWLRWIGMM